MNPTDLAKVAAKHGVSKSVAERNKDWTDKLSEQVATAVDQQVANLTMPKLESIKCKVRIRQSIKPVLNQLETDWCAVIQGWYPGIKVHKQALRVKLANGAWYKADLAMFLPGGLTCWECKGPKVVKGQSKGLLALKVAATEYPEIKWILVWRESGTWHEQRVLS